MIDEKEKPDLHDVAVEEYLKIKKELQAARLECANGVKAAERRHNLKGRGLLEYLWRVAAQVEGLAELINNLEKRVTDLEERLVW